MTQLLIAKVRTDGGTQPRVRTDQATVGEYAEDLAAGCRFPPVVVFFDGKAHWLASGFHRLEAHVLLKRGYIEADVRRGTLREAVLFSVGTNTKHGLKRTNADKEKSVLTLLRDGEWGKWSNRQIARHCGVVEATVRRRRAELSAPETQIGPRLAERGGTVYPMRPRRLEGLPPVEQAAAIDSAERAALRPVIVADAIKHLAAAAALLSGYPDLDDLAARTDDLVSELEELAGAAA